MIRFTIETMATLVQMFLWTWFVTSFFGYKSEKCKVGFYGVWLLTTVELAIINSLIPYDGFLTAIAILTMIVYARICLKGNVFFHIFISIFSMAIIFALAGAVLLFLSFFSGIDMTQMLTELTVWRIIVFLACRILEFVIFRAIIQIKDEYALVTREWALFISLPLLSWVYVVLAMEAVIAAPEVQPHIFYLTLIVVFIDFLIYYFMLKIKQDANAKAERDLLKMQYDNMKTAEANMKVLYDNIYSVKHDLEKHFAAIRVIAERNRDQDVADYTETVLKGTLNEAQKMVFTDNDVFNAIINTRTALCQQKDIFVGINISEEAIRLIRTEDLVVLFGNIFDNAIEAAEKSEKKVIMLNVCIQGEYVSIWMENSYNPEFSGAGHETAKTDRAEHGYGLRNIKKIVEKYDGMMQCMNEEGNMFCCDILLKKG